MNKLKVISKNIKSYQKTKTDPLFQVLWTKLQAIHSWERLLVCSFTFSKLAESSHLLYHEQRGGLGLPALANLKLPRLPSNINCWTPSYNPPQVLGESFFWSSRDQNREAASDIQYIFLVGQTSASPLVPSVYAYVGNTNMNGTTDFKELGDHIRQASALPFPSPHFFLGKETEAKKPSMRKWQNQLDSGNHALNFTLILHTLL